MENKKILVVMGGISSEREVSLRSGEAVYNALVSLGYSTEKFILTENNAFEIAKKKPDLCVLALHGKGGEDGMIQGMLELIGIRYTGSGVASSSVCMNKILTKKVLSFEGIPTPEFYTIKKGENVEAFIERVLQELEFPIVIKAPCQGSSVGVDIVHNVEEMEKAINDNIDFDGEILAERFIAGTELTVPVMQDEKGTFALPVVEIVAENKFYDFEAKYTKGMSSHIIPARISEETMRAIEKYAVESYKALGCSGVARIDFFLSEGGMPYVIEVNTIPGMTETSLVPDSAKAAGMSFEELVDKIVKLELKKCIANGGAC